MKSPKMMLPAPSRAFLRKWIEADRIEDATLEIQLALKEYRDLADAGSKSARAKHAEDNLREIEKHARALSRAIAAMPGRAQWAILDHANSKREEGRHLSDLRVLREDVLLPLVNTAKGAIGCLPDGAGRGRPAREADSPRDGLVRQLAKLYRDAGNRGVEQRGEAPELAFVREVLGQADIDVPLDLARILRPKKQKATAGKSRRS